jgi:hypothetical protein
MVIGAGETKLIGLGVVLDLSGFTPNGCTKCGESVGVYQDRFVGHYCEECGMQLDDEEALEFFMSRYYFDLCMRSSLALKGLIIPNGAGKIDMDYPDELKMMVHNPVQLWDTGNGSVDINCFTPYQVKRGDKIGQLILCRHEGYLLPAEYTLDTERVGGFGSTGE